MAFNMLKLTSAGEAIMSEWQSGGYALQFSILQHKLCVFKRDIHIVGGGGEIDFAVCAG